MTRYVNVPVPEHLVAQVMAFIVSLTSGTAGAASAAPSDQSEASEDWTQAELRQLWDASAEPMRIVLQLLAKRAGKPVSGDAIAQALGKKERGHTVAGMMGALGRRIKHRHRGRWPFSARRNAVAMQWEYVMPASVGSLLLKAIREEG